MLFEIGKYYKHNSGNKLYIITVGMTHQYGLCLIGEEKKYQNFIPIGMDEAATINWSEISKIEYFRDTDDIDINLDGEQHGEEIKQIPS